MGQTQTASTIETTATTPRELMSEHRLTVEEAEQIEAADTSSLVELLEVMPFLKTLNLYSAEGAVQNFGILRATNTSIMFSVLELFSRSRPPTDSKRNF